MPTVFCMQDPNTYGTPDTDEQIIWQEKISDILDNATYIGNNKTKVYHLPECYCKKLILPENLEAIDSNGYDKHGRRYQPCGHCLAKEFNLKDWIDQSETDRQERLEVIE